MIDFLWTVVSAPLWFNIVLVGCAVAVYFAYGIRSLTAPSAWVAFVLFFVWVAASNSWHLLPKVDPSQIETQAELEMAWNIWSHKVRETLIVAYLCAGAITAGVAAWFVWGAYTQTMRFTMLTAFYSFTTFIAQVGNAMERYVCSTNSPDLGREYLFWAEGRAAEACGRLFVDVVGLPEALGTQVGPLFLPALTALPPLILLGRTFYKKKMR